MDKVRTKNIKKDVKTIVFRYLVELVSVDGAFRVISEEFSISLLNPESDTYRRKAQKYSQMVTQKN